MDRKALMVLVVFLAACAASASATTEQVKLYKKAFDLDKAPKCIACHAVQKPKKDENHDLNDYGKKIKALSAEPTEETYKQAGPAPAE